MSNLPSDSKVNSKFNSYTSYLELDICIYQIVATVITGYNYLAIMYLRDRYSEVMHELTLKVIGRKNKKLYMYFPSIRIFTHKHMSVQPSCLQ